MREYGALLQDGHFSISWPDDTSLSSVPIQFINLEDKLYSYATSNELKEEFHS